jgi:hypothetical protein
VYINSNIFAVYRESIKSANNLVKYKLKYVVKFFITFEI